MNKDDTPARGGSPAVAVGAENDGRICSSRGGPRRARSALDSSISRAMWCAMLLQEFCAEGLGAPARRRQQFLRWWRVPPCLGGAVPGGRRVGDSISETDRLL